MGFFPHTGWLAGKSQTCWYGQIMYTCAVEKTDIKKTGDRSSSHKMLPPFSAEFSQLECLVEKNQTKPIQNITQIQSVMKEAFSNLPFF